MLLRQWQITFLHHFLLEYYQQFLSMRSKSAGCYDQEALRFLEVRLSRVIMVSKLLHRQRYKIVPSKRPLLFLLNRSRLELWQD